MHAGSCCPQPRPSSQEDAQRMQEPLSSSCAALLVPLTASAPTATSITPPSPRGCRWLAETNSPSDIFVCLCRRPDGFPRPLLLSSSSSVTIAGRTKRVSSALTCLAFVSAQLSRTERRRVGHHQGRVHSSFLCTLHLRGPGTMGALGRKANKKRGT